MNDEILFRIFNRVITFKLDDIKYSIKSPDIKLRYQAELYKQEVIEDYKYDLPLLEFYYSFLKKWRFIDSDYENKIKNMNDTIKQLKIDLYLSTSQSEEKIRKNLNTMKGNLNKYAGNIDYYRAGTLEYFANNLKNNFIILNTTYQNDELVFDADNINVTLLNEVIEKLNENDLSIDKLKKIARNDEWRNYWLNNKDDLFGIPAIEFSEEQKLLCIFSRFYDNIYEHPERPTPEVIDDDDKLDGWVLLQEKERKKDKGESLSNLPAKYQEVYITANNQDEAAAIYAANSPESKRILKERARVLNNNVEVKDTKFKDVILDNLAHRSELESQFIKGK